MKKTMTASTVFLADRRFFFFFFIWLELYQAGRMLMKFLLFGIHSKGWGKMRSWCQRTSLSLLCNVTCRCQATLRRRRGNTDSGCSSDAPGAVQGPVPTNFPVTNFGSTASALPTLGDEAASNGTMRSLTVSEAEEFFFRDQKGLQSSSSAQDTRSGAGARDTKFQRGGHHLDQTHFCRLCQEDVVAPTTPRQHILASSRISHLNHTCRETVLDTLVLLLRRGYPIDHIIRVWSTTLYHHPAFLRIHALSSPFISMRDRASKLVDILKALSEWKVLDIVFAVVAPDVSNEQAAFNHRRRLSMERTECIGDNSWGHHMSHRMIALFPDRQFLYSQFSYNFNTFRDACEMNLTLTWMFDVLDLAQLFPPYLRDKISDGKMKADIVEAILGELHLNLFGMIPEIYDTQPYVEINGCAERQLASLITHAMTEMYDMLILHFVEELSHSAIPLAKEIAAPTFWRTARTQLTRTKDRTGMLRRRNLTTLRDRVVPLPAKLMLHDCATSTPTHVPHPFRAPPFRLAEAVSPINGSDLFSTIISSYTLDDLNDSLTHTGVVHQIASDRIAWASLRGTLKLGLSCDPPDVLDLDPSEMYFRDPRLDVAQQPQACEAFANREGVSMSECVVRWSSSICYPYLQETPDIVGTGEDDTDPNSSSRNLLGMTCCFAKSVFVPHGVKPPSAGVITEKNLHFGLFFAMATILSSRRNAVKLPPLPQGDVDVGPGVADSTDTAAVGGAISTQQPVLDVVAERAEHLEAATQQAVKAWRQSWLSENPYFAKTHNSLLAAVAATDAVHQEFESSLPSEGADLGSHP